MRKIAFIAVATSCFHLFGASGTWTGDADSNWTTNANWDPGPYPDSSSETATFDDSGQTGAVGVNALVHVGTINFSASSLNYTLSSVSAGTLNQTTQINGTNNSNSTISSDIGNIGSLITISVDLGSQIAISGKLTTTGSLTKTGSGTLTLSGASANAFTFGAHINGGILNVQKNGAIGFGAATVADGAQLQMQGGVSPTSTSMTLNGTGGGTGALLNISGNNTYSGSISLASDTTIGSTAGTMTLSAINAQVGKALNLTSAGAGNITINGVIGSRVVQLTKNDSGTLTLAGNNAYTGGTLIHDGVLSIGSANNIGGSSAPVTLAGGTLSATGNVTSSAAIAVTNSSTITTAASRFTTLNGTLTGSDGAILNLMGDGTNVLSTIAVGESDSFTIAGAFGGSSAMTKTGNGTLIIAGNNTSFTGPMNISAGKLKVNGSLSNSSLLTISVNTTLSGTGSMGPITCYGTLSPGNSVGTISSGDVVLESSSLFFVELDPTGASLLDVTGSVALNGTLEVVQNAGLYARSGQYPILQTTNGLSGSFSSILLSPLSGFTLSVLESGNDLILVYNSGLLTEGLSGNALKIGNYLNQYGTADAINPLLNLDENALENALEKISPARNAFATYSSQNTMFTFSNSVSSHLANQRLCRSLQQRQIPLASNQALFEENELTASLSSPLAKKQTSNPESKEKSPAGSAATMAARQDRYSTWIEGFTEFSHQDSQSQTPAFRVFSGGALLGFDYYGYSGGQIGGAVGYARNAIHQEQNYGDNQINFYTAALYGTGYFGNGYLEGALWGTYNQFNSQRNVVFPGFNGEATASYQGGQLTPHLAGGYDFNFKWGTVEPYASFDAAINFQQGYQEHGASPFNMKVPGLTSWMLRSEIGLNAYQTWQRDWGLCILRETASYINRKPFTTGQMTAAIVGSVGTFSVDSFTSDQNLFSPALELFFRFKRGAFASLLYEGEFGSGYMTNEVLARIGIYF